MKDVSEVRGLHYPRTSSVEDYLVYLEYNYSTQFDMLMFEISKNGIDVGTFILHPKAAVALMDAGLVKPVLTSYDDREYFYFTQWSPKLAQYVEWGSLDEIDTHWFIQCCEAIWSQS